MKDIQFITLSDTIKVVSRTDLGITESSRQVVLYLYPSAKYVSRVIINDYAVDAFTVVSYYEVLLSLSGPLLYIDIDAADITVTASVLTDSSKATLAYGTGATKIKSTEGVQKLVQQVTKILLTTAGSNRFAIGEGGNLMAAVGPSSGKSVKTFIASSLADALQRTESHILERQLGQSIPGTERLVSLSLTGLSFDESNSATAMVSLTTFAGTAFSLPIEI